MKFEKLPALAETLVKWEPGDVLELDELWSFVLKKSHWTFDKAAKLGMSREEHLYIFN
jgi:hypothetical protein